MRPMVSALVLVGALLVFGIVPARADPVTITGGTFVLDQEHFIVFNLFGDVFGVSLHAQGATAVPDVPAGLRFGCHPRCEPGSTFDFSNATTGVQPLGQGAFSFGAAHYDHAGFRGQLTFASPGAPLPSDPDEAGAFLVRLSVPFTFTGSLIVQQDGVDLFSGELVGAGTARALFEGSFGFYALDDQDPIRYDFAPIPEPGSWLLVATGIAGAVVRRRARRGRSTKDEGRRKDEGRMS